VAIETGRVKRFVSMAHDNVYNFLSLGERMDSRGVHVRLAESSSTLVNNDLTKLREERRNKQKLTHKDKLDAGGHLEVR